MSEEVPDTLEAEVVADTTPSPSTLPSSGAVTPEVVLTDDAPSGVVVQLPIVEDLPDAKPVYTPGRHERLVRWAVLLLAALVFLPNLGAFGLWDPWETHYGAVTTEMLDTYDWVSPWWGYREQIGTEKPQGNYFYSKPILIFWTEAALSRVFGRGEWALRLPMALLAIMAVFLTYLALSKIWSRRVGLLGALVAATGPEFYMISRQAQTDMPFVGTLMIAMLFFMLAVFGPREPMEDRRFKRWTWFTAAFVLLNTLPQYLLLANDLGRSGVVQASGYIAALALLGLFVVLAWRREHAAEGLSDAFKDRWLRRLYLAAFYVLLAQSTCAKGLLGFLLPGAIILFYLVVSRNWRLLAKVELIRGIVLFVLVGFPWYVAMLILHKGPYYQRFFIHDHFKRIDSGVHQIDSGTFEHFIKWLGVGTFPWVAFVPLALLWLVRTKARDNRAPNQAKLLVAVWFAVAFFLFTWSSTKFHHYIFPAYPALAIIVALFIAHLMKQGQWLARLSALVGVGMVLAVGWGIHEDPQQIRNLMTYKYERPMPQHLPTDPEAKVSATGTTTWQDSYFYKHISPTLRAILTTDALSYEGFIRFIIIAGIIALGLFFVAKTRTAGLVGLGLTAGMLAVWSLNYYMPMLTPHWSQKYLFDAYYETCTKIPLDDYTIEAFEPLTVKLGLTDIDEEASSASYTTGLFRGQYKTMCEEDVISWLITWRGETYYSWNELKPIAKKEPQFMPYLRDFNGGKKFYVLIERGKHSSFRSTLKSNSDKLKREGRAGWTDITDWTVNVENDENKYFQMVSATPVRK
ncbi:MAG: hypothetical protein CSA66_01945 [Proteobacteria bacterium]|nr:MAG: hypothetical protein CSA66_01945 [Pseudomonadota bacterium]